jgi:hypothetical protein
MDKNKPGFSDPDLFSDDWGRQSTFLQNQFPELTDDDLEFEPGHEQQLFNRIGIKLNKNHKEVISLLIKSHLATV